MAKGDSQGALFAGYPSARTTTGKLAEWNMSRRSRLRASLRRKLRRPGSANDSSAEPRARGSLLRRAQQWLAARERLLADWIARARGKRRWRTLACWRASDACMAKSLPAVSAALAPSWCCKWWEYESPLRSGGWRWRQRCAGCSRWCQTRLALESTPVAVCVT